MRISAAVEAMAADLVALGALGDETAAEVARRLAAAMEGPITARLLESLGLIATELDATLPAGRVEIRLSGGDAELVLVPDEHPDEQPDETADDDDTSARITLRLPGALKARIEAASTREGVSVNTYIVRALGQQARTPPRPKVGRRLSGYGRS